MSRQIDSAVVMGEHGDPHDPELNPHCNIVTVTVLRPLVEPQGAEVVTPPG